MGGNGTDTEAGRIDVVSCGVGFPKDAETPGLRRRQRNGLSQNGSFFCKMKNNNKLTVNTLKD